MNLIVDNQCANVILGKKYEIFFQDDVEINNLQMSELPVAYFD